MAIIKNLVRRYRLGKPPHWVSGAHEEEEEGGFSFTRRDRREDGDGDDPRLRCLEATRTSRKKRRIQPSPDIVFTTTTITMQEEEEEENKKVVQPQQGLLDLDDEDEVASAERRRKLRDKLLQREEEEAMLIDEEEESEYETTDLEKEEIMGIAMLKIVYVPKSKRDTIAERERLEAEEQALEEFMNKRKEEIKVETKQILADEIHKDEAILKSNLQVMNDANTDDEANEVEEYEAWKAREITRIKRGFGRKRLERIKRFWSSSTLY